MKVGITYHEKYSQYDLGPGHPFRGDRFRNAIHFFREHGLLSHSSVVMIEPEPTSREDLLRVHDEEYVDLIFRLAKDNRPYDIETPVSREILEATLLIVGGAVSTGKAVYEGRVNRAVALGCGYHHAGKNYGGGFCLFNDIGVLVEVLRGEYGLRRILILDHDVHFGNGTSDIYYEDPDILFISLHQDPRTIYPGTGFIEQIGRGDGEGFNVNVPLPPQTSDQSYLYALNEIFVPMAEEFKPELIVTNGGSDPHFADMLGNLGLTVKGFFKLSKTIRAVAERVCQDRVILMPGSGYNPAVLPQCWYALAAGIVDLKTINAADPYPPPDEPSHVRPRMKDTLTKLKRILRKYWTCFR